MKFQTFIAVVASVGVVATAAFVGGVGADVGVPSTGDIVSSAEDATPDETSDQTAAPTATPDQTETENPPSESDQTDAESSSPETESSEPAESTTTASESESTDAESAANETAKNETAENNTAPVAAAGADAMVHERTRVELDAGDSRDPDGDELNYTWTQISGPDAELSGNNTSTASFVSPDVAVWTDVTFRVAVTDAAGANDTATVTVTVRSTDYPETTDSAGESRSADESDSADETDSEETNASAPEETNASADLTRDEISRAVFGAEFDALDTEDAVYVEELYLRQPSGEWDPTEVRSREAIARDRYNRSFDELGFDAHVDVQETFDAQFGDTGENATYSHDELTQAQWGYNFSEVSGESAGQIAEMYDRQPFAENQELEHVATRDKVGKFLYNGTELANLTREQRLTVEREYHGQFEE